MMRVDMVLIGSIAARPPHAGGLNMYISIWHGVDRGRDDASSHGVDRGH